MELLDAAVARLEQVEAIDDPADRVADAVTRFTHRPPLSSILSGTWLGHPLHPVLTDLPIGCWTSAFVLDFVGGNPGRRAAQTLVGLGVLSAVGSSRVDLQACKLEYSIVSPK